MLVVLLTAAALAAPPPTPAQADMHRALSHRDGAPPCAEIEALSEAPVDDLKYVVNHISAPPWAGMRAAQCLIERHPAAIEAELDLWVTDPGRVGLGILVLNRLDDLPVDTAVRVASLALEKGSERMGAEKRVAAAARPEVHTLVAR